MPTFGENGRDEQGEERPCEIAESAVSSGNDPIPFDNGIALAKATEVISGIVAMRIV